MEQAVIVHLRLRNGDFGSPDERDAITVLEDQIMLAIDDASAGELDGDEFGGGECVLFIYGPDANRLYGLIEPLLKAAPPATGGYAIKRYGEASNPTASEVRLTW